MTREEQLQREIEVPSMYNQMNGMENVFINGAIKGAEWADTHPAWVMCEDRLPEDGEQVYCYMKSGSYEILVWTERFEVWDDAEGYDCFCDKDQVLAWFELPEFNPIKE